VLERCHGERLAAAYEVDRGETALRPAENPTAQRAVG
jgi:hypothetical protein